jgi:hypothetical protein
LYSKDGDGTELLGKLQAVRPNLKIRVFPYAREITKLFIMMQIIKKKKSKAPSLALTKDPKKEGILKALAGIIEKAGVEVRREELKRGPGWRATSGFCRHNQSPVIFVDRILPQDDQINFLLDKITELKISAGETDVEGLIPLSLSY